MGNAIVEMFIKAGGLLLLFILALGLGMLGAFVGKFL